jgi:hypothetical protein
LSFCLPTANLAIWFLCYRTYKSMWVLFTNKKYIQMLYMIKHPKVMKIVLPKLLYITNCIWTNSYKKICWILKQW